MHEHLEIIMPPTDDVEASVSQIMAPFGEEAKGEEASSQKFCDYWEIGGRWSGNKILSTFSPDQIGTFYQRLKDAKITVSSLQFGKQTLQPASQAETVNRLWRETFPDAVIKECPLFDNYQGADGDIMPLRDIPPELKCTHVIIAGPRYDGNGFEAAYMVRDSLWNGVTHQKTTWSGTVAGALAEWKERLTDYRPEWAAEHTPKEDWIVVTVDYHH
jgi:hypothetical protein